MRTIIHFMGMTSTKFGGLEKFMIELIKANRDCIFVLVYDSYPKSEEYAHLLCKYNVKIEIVPFNTFSIANQFKGYYSIVKKYCPEIIHFHFLSNDIGVIVARLCGVKKTYKTVHSCLSYNNKPIESVHQLGFRERVKSLGGLIIRMYTKILFVSEYTMNQYIQIYGKLSSYVVIYLGVNKLSLESTKEITIPKHKKVITSILFSHPMKGADVLLKALRWVDDIILLLIGLDDSQYTETLRKLAATLGIEDKIKWVGIVDNVSDYLTITDIYVQPSRTEALSLAACEALSLGIPVVGSNVGGLPEVASLLFESEDSRQLANILNTILSDNQTYKALSLESIDRFNAKFRINESVSQYKSIYDV